MRAENLPPVFEKLGLPVVHTGDGFWMSRKSIADMLLEKEIRTFPNDQGQLRECGLFFDDWHLYAIEAGDWIYSLVKLREQEHDREEGRIGDGDTPGVTVSFIAFRPEILMQCLESPTMENRRAMNREINRVVSVKGQSHHPALKAYFEKTESLRLLRRTMPGPAIPSATTGPSSSVTRRSSTPLKSWRFLRLTPPTCPFPVSPPRCSTTPVFSLPRPGFPFPFWAIPFTTAPFGRT